jgi:protein phosphatase
VKLDIHARTDVGLLRPQNEDAFSVWTAPSPSAHDRALLAVADGMGGHPGGEIASALAVEAACEVAASNLALPPREVLRRVYEEAAIRIDTRGREDLRYREMGTTLTSVILFGGLAHVGHIGDTRMYWIRGGQCHLITRDHNVAQDLVNSGRLEADIAEDHPMANVLTRCLGVCPDQTPDILGGALRLGVGDVLLLATDGLAKTVHARTLVELIQETNAEVASDRLVKAALAGGAPDNVTVILARVLEVGETAPSSGDRVYEFEAVAELDWPRD